MIVHKSAVLWWHPGQWDLFLSRSCSIETVTSSNVAVLNDAPILSISKPRISVGVNCTIGMDWPRDNIGLSERDLENVFKYEPKYTTIVRMLTSSKVRSRPDSRSVQRLTGL